MAKFGKILNLYVDSSYTAFITDEHGNMICELPYPEDYFGLKSPQGEVHLKLDMETGVVLNWKELTKDQIVDLIEKSS